MREGRLAQVGTPADVYERPNSRFVAEFLGAANILPAVACADGTRLELPGLHATVCTATRVAAGAVLLAIRPERVRLGRPDWPNALPGVIIDRAYGGESLTHTVRLADGSLMRATRSLRDGLDEVETTIGDTVTLSWQPAACILLPA